MLFHEPLHVKFYYIRTTIIIARGTASIHPNAFDAQTLSSHTVLFCMDIQENDVWTRKGGTNSTCEKSKTTYIALWSSVTHKSSKTSDDMRPDFKWPQPLHHSNSFCQQAWTITENSIEQQEHNYAQHLLLHTYTFYTAKFTSTDM